MVTASTSVRMTVRSVESPAVTYTLPVGVPLVTAIQLGCPWTRASAGLVLLAAGMVAVTVLEVRLTTLMEPGMPAARLPALAT